MNQTQRDFLIKQVERTYKRQYGALKESQPSPPSLNNYLVAAILDGSFQLQTTEDIKDAIRTKVLELGPSDALIENDSYNYRKHRDDGEDTVALRADVLFVLPDGYTEARAAYDTSLAKWETEMEHLEQYKETIILKIQIGSPQVLAKLIEQVDNLADLNIVNTNLLLTAPDGEQKKLKA